MRRFASIVLIDQRGWLLLQERDDHPSIDPEKWGFCGGHVEEGESVEPAAYRELAEETGVVLTEGLSAYGTFGVFHQDTGTVDELTLFIARTTLTDADIECHEGRQIVFVEPSRALKLDLGAAAAQILPGLVESLADQA